MDMGKSKIYLMGLAGGYLVYLGIQQFILLLRKEASVPWLNALSGLLFIVVGGLVVVREWKAHKALTAPADPADEDAEEEDEEEEADEEGEDEE
ncbi:MAG: hypothetical protein IJA71_03290 [Clostridia bacterium]|nr:hypothetical protein [Clostridia bacterium]